MLDVDMPDSLASLVTIGGLRVLGDGTIYFGAVAGAVVTIVGAIYALWRANTGLIRSQVKEPLEELGRQINARIDTTNRNLNGNLDRRIDERIARRVQPVAEQVEHIDQELAKHLPGYRKATP